MPQPRRRRAAPAPPPPPQETPGAQRIGMPAAVGAGAAAAAGPAAQSAVGAAAAAAAAEALRKGTPSMPSQDAVGAAVATLLSATDRLFRQRRATFAQHVEEVARAQMPGAPADRVSALAREEVRREAEFQRKARGRLERDLPRALKQADPLKRAEAVEKILEREKRYLRQREDASAQRVVTALEMDLVRASSPEGAYWHLSPLIREHCLKCLAMGGKFWPWEVLDLPDMHLPQHPNCGCRLLTFAEAVAQGLMDPDQVPDTKDAMRRAKVLMDESGRIQESMAPEELEDLIRDLEGLRVQEASARKLLRWAKGYQKGGEFAPRGGGNPGQRLLREMARAESPAAAKLAKRGRHTTVGGEEHFIPQAEHWQAKVKGRTYTSPAGGTNLYRDGILVNDESMAGADPYDARVDQDPRFAKPKGQPKGDHTVHMPPIARPSHDKPIPDYSGTHLELGKRAGGSTGAQWAFDQAGGRWLMKGYSGNQDRVATELLANAVYRDLGARVAPAGTFGAEGEPDFESIPDVTLEEPKLPKGRVSTGMIVRDEDGSLWIYEPKGQFGGYEHTFPKGGLEPELTPQQNAHKELWEETGLHAHITGYVGDYKGDTGVSRYYLAVRTGGEPHADDPTPYERGGSETAAVKRVSPEDAEALLNRTRDKQILKDALALGVPEEAKDPPPDAFPSAKQHTLLAYPAVEGQTRRIEKPDDELSRHYMADALVANWDFIGLADDNVLWAMEDGQEVPIRLDQGGTFQFRAQGAEKPYGPVPTEVWTMLGPKGQGFGKVTLTEGQMRDQARAIGERLTPSRIDQLVDSAPFGDEQMREEIRQNTKARVQWMRDFANGDQDLPQALEGRQARVELTAWQRGLEPFPEQQAALDSFLADPDPVQQHLQSGAPKDRADRGVQNTVARLDQLLRQTRTDDDMTLYKPVDPELLGDLGDLPGKRMSSKGYLNASTRMSAGRAAPAYLRLAVPAGTRALYAQDLVSDERLDEDMEVLMPRGTRIHVASVEERGGRTVINGVVIPA